MLTFKQAVEEYRRIAEVIPRNSRSAILITCSLDTTSHWLQASKTWWSCLDDRPVADQARAEAHARHHKERPVWDVKLDLVSGKESVALKNLDQIREMLS